MSAAAEPFVGSVSVLMILSSTSYTLHSLRGSVLAEGRD